MLKHKGVVTNQNTFLDTIATRFDGTHSNFVLGNAQASGCPIVYCSDGFCELTEFARAHVMGRSCACKFLFGEKTCEKERENIDNALENKTELKTEVVLYQKYGRSFLCLLDIVPIKNEKSQVVLFLVSYKDIPNERGSGSPADKQADNDGNSDDSEEEMMEAYKRSLANRGRSSGAVNLPQPPQDDNFRYQRRRSRAVLYHLSGQFQRQNKAKSTLQKLNQFSSISAKMPEYKVQEVKKSRYVIVHYGIFKIGWDWLILLCTFYTAVMVPYNAAFTYSVVDAVRSSIASDVVVEILFIFDIVLNFRTSYLNKNGQVVYEPKQIAINYFKGWFLLDLLAAIPFDFLFVFKISTTAPVHLLKLARLLRLARLPHKIDRFSQYSALVLALMMSMFALLAHWLACIWYAIGNAEFNGDGKWTAGWLFELSERLDEPVHANKTNRPDLLTSYLAALYFTCSSLTSVGFGNVSANTNAEKIFSICAMIVGALMHAVVFGNVTAIIQRMYSRRQTFHSKTKDLKDFFRTYNIPKPLKQRMQEYFQTMWSMNNGIETQEILKDFPEEMRGEIGLHLHSEILSLPIFENATQGFMKSISLHTKKTFCAPGESLVHKGDTVNYLYLLCSGSMEILKEDMVVAILGKGDLFGVDINVDDPIHVTTNDVRSLTYCELQCINVRGLVDVLLLYPAFAEGFVKDIQHDLTYNLREGAEEEDSDEDSNSEGSKKGRVFTLPSISEDDELSPSDDEDGEKAIEDLPKDDDSDYRTPSISSPLLPVRKSPKLPNGDIDVFHRDDRSPPMARNIIQLRRGSLQQRKASVKEKKSRASTTSPDSFTGNDRVHTYVQNIQNDVEGTKSSVKQLERKLNKMGQDMTSIDLNMQTLLKQLVPSSRVRFGDHVHSKSVLSRARKTLKFGISPTEIKESLETHLNCYECSSKIQSQSVIDATSAGSDISVDTCSAVPRKTRSTSDEHNKVSQVPFLRGSRDLCVNESFDDDLSDSVSSFRTENEVEPSEFAKYKRTEPDDNKKVDLRANKSSGDLVAVETTKKKPPLIRRHSDGPDTSPKSHKHTLSLGIDVYKQNNNDDHHIKFFREVHDDACSLFDAPQGETGRSTVKPLLTPEPVTHIHTRDDGGIFHTTDL